MKDGSNTTLMLGALAIVAASGVAVYALKRPATGTAPTAGGTAPTTGSTGGGLNIGNGLTSPGQPAHTLPVVGDSAAATEAAAKEAARLAELERQREAKWRRDDQIRALQSELSTVQNRLKVITAELNRIDALPPSAEVTAAWKARHVADCQGAVPFYSKAWCASARNDLSEGYDARRDADWKERQQGMKQPLLVEASQLNTRQGELISNLAALGVTVPAVSGPAGATAGTASAGGASAFFGGINVSDLFNRTKGGGNSTQPVYSETL